MSPEDQKIWDFLLEHLKFRVNENLCHHRVSITVSLVDPSSSKQEQLDMLCFDVGEVNTVW